MQLTKQEIVGVASGEYPANWVCRFLQPVFGEFYRSLCWIWQIWLTGSCGGFGAGGAGGVDGAGDYFIIVFSPDARRVG